jgi:hypothetical protein
MNNWTPNPKLEEKIRQSFGVPEIRSEFVNQTYQELMTRATQNPKKHHQIFGLRPAWTIILAIITLMILSTFIIGPDQVYAGFMKLLGYVPGVGIVDQTSPLRILAEPVSMQRDGITVSVN